MDVLKIKNFAHIAEVSLKLGDLTVLVGAQGTGKSLALQWLKAALDGKQITTALREAGHQVSSPEAVIDLIFGMGMGSSWRDDSAVSLNRKAIQPARLDKLGSDHERVLFIPAHRAMLVSDGWAMPFQKFTADTPVVARLFSQRLHEFLSLVPERGHPRQIIPTLPRPQQQMIDDAVFHGGKVRLEQDRQHAWRLKLFHGKTQIPFMAWTAGQREFTPLLLALPREYRRWEWVVIEEPEMGLHPQAILAFLLLTLDLLAQGYRVVLSTHSPLVLTVVWALRRLQATQGRWQLLCEAFGVKTTGMKELMETALRKSYYTHLLSFGKDGRVYSKDISSLDPGNDDDEVSGWGGLTGFGSRFAEVVRQAANGQVLP